MSRAPDAVRRLLRPSVALRRLTRARYAVLLCVGQRNAQSVASKKPLGVIDILNATTMACPDYKGRANIFRVRVIRGASFLFMANTADDVHRWMAAIELAARGGMDEEGQVPVSKEGGPSLLRGYPSRPRPRTPVRSAGCPTPLLTRAARSPACVGGGGGG